MAFPGFKAGRQAVVVLSCLWTGLLCFQALAQAPSEATHALATVLTHKYLQSERALEQWFSTGMANKVQQQLSDDFSAHIPPDEELGQKPWIERQIAQSRTPWAVTNLQASLQDDICVVSFLRIQPQTRKWQFIVDIWRESSQKLLARFEGPLSSHPLPSRTRRGSARDADRSPSGKD